MGGVSLSLGTLTSLDSLDTSPSQPLSVSFNLSLNPRPLPTARNPNRDPHLTRDREGGRIEQAGR